MTKNRTLSGFIIFLFKEILRQKKWILLPVWIIMAALAVVFILGSGSYLLPAIYIGL